MKPMLRKIRALLTRTRVKPSKIKAWFYRTRAQSNRIRAVFKKIRVWWKRIKAYFLQLYSMDQTMWVFNSQQVVLKPRKSSLPHHHLNSWIPHLPPLKFPQMIKLLITSIVNPKRRQLPNSHRSESKRHLPSKWVSKLTLQLSTVTTQCSLPSKAASSPKISKWEAQSHLNNRKICRIRISWWVNSKEQFETISSVTEKSLTAKNLNARSFEPKSSTRSSAPTSRKRCRSSIP
jgi:hypothetical protein